jgi:hypothetical protein
VARVNPRAAAARLTREGQIPRSNWAWSCAHVRQARALGQTTKHCDLVSNGPSRALGQTTKHILDDSTRT